MKKLARFGEPDASRICQSFSVTLMAYDEATTRDFVTRLYRRVPVLDTGARASTISFARRKLGDVLIAWENDAFLALKEFGAGNFDIVVPSMSILAEPPVAVVDKNAEAKGNGDLARAYLDFLYSPRGQAVIAKNYLRPQDASAADPADLARFPKIDLVTIDGAFGGWAKAQQTHFADGGLFDQLYKPTQ